MIILAILGFGMAVGWLAHVIVEGNTRNDWAFDLLAGVVGSFVGGLLASLLAGDGLALRPSGLIGSLVGAMLFLLVRKWMNRTRAAHQDAHHHGPSGNPKVRSQQARAKSRRS